MGFIHVLGAAQRDPGGWIRKESTAFQRAFPVPPVHLLSDLCPWELPLHSLLFFIIYSHKSLPHQPLPVTGTAPTLGWDIHGFVLGALRSSVSIPEPSWLWSRQRNLDSI